MDLVCCFVFAGVVALAACAAPTVPTAEPLPTMTPAARISFSTPTIPPPRTAAPTKSPFAPSKLPTPTPAASKVFDDVDSILILATLFPNLKFTPNGDMFVVNGNPRWLMWVNSRAEGHFTDLGGSELAAIIANESPEQNAAGDDNNPPWGSFLAVLARDNSLRAVHRDYVFPVSISPMSFDVDIERAVDYDRDDQDDLFITTTATRLGVTTRAGFLYQWVDKSFAEIWSASLSEDNTASLNQSRYYASNSDVSFADLDGAGVDSIVIDTTRIDYAHGPDGLVDIDHEVARRTERRVYRWIGKGYTLDPARATPMSPIASPTP